MDLSKYLPKQIRRRVRKSLARSRDLPLMAEYFSKKRDDEIKGRAMDYENFRIKEGEYHSKLLGYSTRIFELEKDLAEKKNKIEEIQDSAKNLKGAYNEHLAQVFLSRGRQYEHFPKGINQGLVKIAEEMSSENKYLKENLEKANKGNFKELIANLCDYKNIDRVPLIAFCDGSSIYTTNSFDKYTLNFIPFSSGNLEKQILGESPLSKNLSNGKTYRLEGRFGDLIFSKNNIKKGPQIVVAYFVPTSKKGDKDKREKIFERQGKRAANEMYKTLKGLHNKGRNLTNGKRRN